MKFSEALYTCCVDDNVDVAFESAVTDAFFTYIDEGANIDQYQAFKEFKTEFRPKLASLKKNIKAKNKVRAMADLHACQKMIKDVRKDLDKIDEYSDLGSMMLGQMAHNLVICAKVLGVTFATLGAGGIFYAAAKELQIIVRMCKSISKGWDSGRSIEPKDFNTWRNAIYGKVDNFEKVLKRCEVLISKM